MNKPKQPADKMAERDISSERAPGQVEGVANSQTSTPRAQPSQAIEPEREEACEQFGEEQFPEQCPTPPPSARKKQSPPPSSDASR